MASSRHDDFKRSTENLKKAVPLMMKHQVATTPANYALWYTYVDNAVPELTEAMDKILDDNAIVPPSTHAKLYQHHVVDKSDRQMQQLKNSVERLLTEASASIDDTLSDTNAFSSKLDQSFQQLAHAESNDLTVEQVMTLVRQLITESHTIRHSTDFFHQQLQNAQQEIHQLKRQLSEMQKDALNDGLTELLNRRAFDRDLQAAVDSESAFSLVMLDIDYFKAFNDNFGHLFGDAVLKALAKRLQSSCRDGATAYRFGGEEFVLLLPNRNLRSARLFADTLRRSIEKLRVKERRSGKQMDKLTASFGVAEWQLSESAESIINRADEKLYEAKQLGRNRVMPL